MTATVKALILLAVGVALAVTIGQRMPSDWLAIAVGVVIGIAVGVPAGILITATGRHSAPRDYSDQRREPPVVIVQTPPLPPAIQSPQIADPWEPRRWHDPDPPPEAPYTLIG